jgi:hypothetical protein
MARCTNCDSSDGDVDWGLCYECWVHENERTSGALSRVAAMNYTSMGMDRAADASRNHAKQIANIQEIKHHLESHPDDIDNVLLFLKLRTSKMI